MIAFMGQLESVSCGRARWSREGDGGPVGVGVVAGLIALVVAAGCQAPPEGLEVVVPERPAYRTWIKVEPPGAVCGNGSQYKFFVSYSATSNNLVIAMEPGGACWDYPSCTGASGIRGAANINGIADDHVDLAPFIVPFFQRELSENHTEDWNYVYLPYCTGDVHTGNAVATYTDPEGAGPPVTYHHQGHNNVQLAIEWMASQFENVPRLLVTGCSAGGAGSITNYDFIRKGLPGVKRGFMLNDSGPIFPNGGFSKPLHDKIREAWSIDSILVDLPTDFDKEDFGSVNLAMAHAYPDDRFATTYFRRDNNFSGYSYDRFYDNPPKEEIMDMWWADTQLLMAQYDSEPNLSYYLPYWRALNESHCTTLISYAGSEIQEKGVKMEDWIADFLDPTTPLESLVESVQPGEDVGD